MAAAGAIAEGLGKTARGGPHSYEARAQKKPWRQEVRTAGKSAVADDVRRPGRGEAPTTASLPRPLRVRLRRDSAGARGRFGSEFAAYTEAAEAGERRLRRLGRVGAGVARARASIGPPEAGVGQQRAARALNTRSWTRSSMTWR